MREERKQLFCKGGIIILNILLALFVFGIYIFIHELGHYIFARKFDVAIKEFSVGMGPKLISKKSNKTGIVYSLRLLPIGGFLSMVGEDGGISKDTAGEYSADGRIDDPRALNRKPVWQRMIITLGGAFMNIMLGLLIVLMIVSLNPTYVFPSNEVALVDGISKEAGLLPGDKIVKINNKRVHIASDVFYEISMHGAKPLTIEVIRDGKKIIIKDVKFATIEEGGISMGSPDFKVTREKKTILNVIKHTFYTSRMYVKMIWESLFGLIRGDYGVDQLSGPVGITREIGSAAKQGLWQLMSLSALITINLGVVNVFPLPALDGGRFVFQIIEVIRRKPIKPEIEAMIHSVGLVALMGLILFVTYKDIVKVFVK